eukprot:Nk52_evm3s302 gene=Nk52_evmTU3s302
MRFLFAVVAFIAVIACVSASGSQPLDDAWTGFCTPNADASEEAMRAAYDKWMAWYLANGGANGSSSSGHDLNEVTGIYSFSPVAIKMTLLINWLEGNSAWKVQNTYINCEISGQSVFGFGTSRNAGQKPAVGPAVDVFAAQQTQTVPESICTQDKDCIIPKIYNGAEPRPYEYTYGYLAIELQRLCSKVYVLDDASCGNNVLCNGSNGDTCQCLNVAGSNATDDGIKQYGGSGALCKPIYDGTFESQQYDLVLAATFAANNAAVKASTGAGPVFDDYTKQYMFEISPAGSPHVVPKIGMYSYFGASFSANGHY